MIEEEIRLSRDQAERLRDLAGSKRTPLSLKLQEMAEEIDCRADVLARRLHLLARRLKGFMQDVYKWRVAS